MNFETVCGLEVHTELLTKTKIFCSCSNIFKAEPNTNICPFCLGIPGTLPVLNEKVLELAVRCALALNCTVSEEIKFDRKNYFYPDLPKAYQISQLYLTIGKNGYVTLKGGKIIRIHEIHMEEDAGKLIHEGGDTLIDYNRAGVPLIEIVSEPDISSGKEAAEYTEKLREILMFCGISDCKMQEGSLRADVNVSVREKGSDTLATRTEMKNLASFKAIASAVDTEAKRQKTEIEKGNVIIQETRRWDEDKNMSFSMRNKETASDYRYFPEPDIPPVKIEREYVDKIKKALPELPDEKRKRYAEDYNLSEYDADIICSKTEYVSLFEKTLKLTNDAKLTANWLMGEVTALEKVKGALAVTPEALSKIILFEREGKISRESAKEVLKEVFNSGVDVEEYIRAHALETVKDSVLIEKTVKEVIEKNQKALSEYKAGKEKAFNFLLGQSMKALKGKAIANEVKQKLMEEISDD
ncbi:MAG: Asp-tRNA(Asn)/Glu-tRNA(Gln) amidotransferase subunit GatB [Eubacterium sp.]|nr:Asp-tRNA(Asn)/Glu-tRNA(Gln) amidotransferase subunit GatB [Eubacterium sp.]